MITKRQLFDVLSPDPRRSSFPRLCPQLAQSLTSKPIKGMLTGPVTVLNWSFPRKDLTRQAQAEQLARALRHEITALEGAGCKVVQVGRWQDKTEQTDRHMPGSPPARPSSHLDPLASSSSTPHHSSSRSPPPVFPFH